MILHPFQLTGWGYSLRTTKQHSPSTKSNAKTRSHDNLCQARTAEFSSLGNIDQEIVVCGMINQHFNHISEICIDMCV